MNSGLEEENQQLQAKVKDLEIKISEMLSKKNAQNEELSNQMKGMNN